MNRIHATAALVILAAFMPNWAMAGVVTTDIGTECGAGLRDDSICRDIRIHPWSGKVEVALGLDGALALRSADTHTFSTRINSSDTGATTFKNEGTQSMRFGATARLEILERIGAGVTAGVADTSTDATPETAVYYSSSGSYPFKLEYTGPYVETGIYFPVQRLNTWGLFGGVRRYLSTTASATNENYGGSVKLDYTAETTPQDFFLGAFIGPVYFNLVSAKEIWRRDQDNSLLDNSGSGFEIGVSGPLTVLFPR